MLILFVPIFYSHYSHYLFIFLKTCLEIKCQCFWGNLIWKRGQFLYLISFFLFIVGERNEKMFLFFFYSYMFGDITQRATALFWLVRTETQRCSRLYSSDLSRVLIRNGTAALRWWGRLIRKYKICICKIKEAADSYTIKVIMAQVLRPNNAEAPRGSNQKFILIIMRILH